MSVATTATGSEAASDVLSRMDAAIATMKECRKEFATALSKTVRSAATKARNAQKRKEKKEAIASGVPLPPKERTSAWQAFSAGDEVHGTLSAVEAYPAEYAAWLAEQKDAKQALTRFAKFARTADFGKADYAKLEERFADRKSTASSGGASSAKKSRKLTDEQKAANKAARAAKKAADKAAAAPPTPAKAKAKAKAPAAPAAPKKAAEKPISSSSSSPTPKKKLLMEEDEEEKPKGKGKGKGKGKAAPPPSDDEEEEKPKAKAKPKGKAAAPPPPPPKEEKEGEALKPYKLKGKDVLRTADNYLFEKAAGGDFGDYIGLLGEDGEVDADAPNPFDVDE